MWVLPAMLVLGALGGAALRDDPGVLRVWFGVSEILSSLMLVYVAQLGLDCLVRGPWRDPQGLQFPDHRRFRSGGDAAGADSTAAACIWASFLRSIVVALAAVLLRPDAVRL